MSEHVCPICGKVLDNGMHGNAIYCSPACRRKATNMKSRVQKREDVAFRKAHGLCIKCGKQEARKGKTLCWACAKNNSDAYMVTYEGLKERKICCVCGNKPAEKGKTLCLECSIKSTEKKMLRWYERKARHCCPICNTPLPKDYDFTTCLRCRAKNSIYKARCRSAA